MTTLVQRLKETAAGVSISLAIASGEAPAQAALPSESRSATHVSGTKPPATYADGTYVARGWYGGRSSSITVTLTLSDDVITAVEVRPHATDPASLALELRFAAAIADTVIGKRVGRVRVACLTGSGGTAEGFNEAVRIIREAADMRLVRARFRNA